MKKSQTPIIQTTKDYSIFSRCDHNRPVKTKGRKGLYNSMKLYGWLPSFPMTVWYDAKGYTLIKDGQHRFEIAKELGIPVFYVLEERDIDISVINQGIGVWKTADYAGSFAQRGNTDYIRLLEFCEEHKISVQTAVGLLSGTCSPNNRMNSFKCGEWRITEEAFAEKVCEISTAFSAYGVFARKDIFITAVSSCCRVEAFKPERLLRAVKRCPDKARHYGTIDATLSMLEEIYNFGQQSPFCLKIEVRRVMKERNAVKPSKAKLIS